MRKMYLFSIYLLLIFVSFSMPSAGRTAIYYIGSAGGGDGSSPNDLQTLSWANANLKAGDTAYLRSTQGNYTGSNYINPSHSGSEGNYLTYRAFSGDTPTFTGTYAAKITDKSYIVIDGLHALNTSNEWILATRMDHSIIKNCNFSGADQYAGLRIEDPSDAHGCNYNQILNNIFTATKAGGGPKGDTILLNGYSTYNLFEGNTVKRGYHAAFMIREGSKYNVIRNNVFDNDWWTVFNLNTNSHHNLFEYNIFKNGGTNFNENPDPQKAPLKYTHEYSGFQAQRVQYTIFRNNIMLNNGTGMKWVSTDALVLHSRVYNNTSYLNEISWQSNTADDQFGNWYKNNIFSTHRDGGQGFRYVVKKDGSDAPNKQEYWTANLINDPDNWWYLTQKGKTLSVVSSSYSSHFPETGRPDLANSKVASPKFTNAPYDFSLSSDSPAIDSGSFLTIITSPTGSGTSFVVKDALYFYSGWLTHIPGEAGDTIKTQNRQIATITFIDYTTNTITVDRHITWVNGEGVALDYSGAAPDIGAYEYDGNPNQVQAPTAPIGLRIIN